MNGITTKGGGEQGTTFSATQNNNSGTTIVPKNEDKGVSVGIKENFSTQQDVSKILAKIENNSNYGNIQIAQNIDTPPEILAMLAKNKSVSVRARVARNLKTSPETLAILAKDKNEWVRIEVARNPNTPKDILATLAKDENVSVNSWAKKLWTSFDDKEIV